MYALLEGLEMWLEESGLDALTTFFWICGFCNRQLEGEMEDAHRLGAVVQSMAMTVMFLEPWDRMVETYTGESLNCLSRIWCVGARAHVGVRHTHIHMPLAPPPLPPPVPSNSLPPRSPFTRRPDPGV